MNRFTLSIYVLLLVLAVLSLPLLGSVAYAADDSWVTLEPMPTARNGFGVAVVNGKIYAIGGYNRASGSYLASNEMYDPATNTWTTKASMPTPRSNFGIAVVDNKIYAIGGGAINEVYDPKTNTWETLTAMPTPRRGLSVSTVNGKIWCIGGHVGESPYARISAIEFYDPATDTWSTAKEMPVAVTGHASAVVDNKIYILGGAVGLSFNQIYDTETDTWSNGTELPTGVDPAAAAVIVVEGTQKICVIGGKKNLDAVNLNQIYDPETDTWSTGASMPTSRYSLEVAVVDNLVYAIGGVTGWLIYPSVGVNEQYTPAGHVPEFYSQVFDAGTWEDTQYTVFVVSNSTVSDFSFNPEGAQVSFKIEGELGTMGFCNVTIPKNLLYAKNAWTVLVDGISVTPTVNQKENYTTLHFTYSHDAQTIQIIGTDAIPEFPSWAILSLVITAMLVTIIYKHRLKRLPLRGV
ncbi:MAG: kelch repeat-containing protein [Candidatus Bathyarchaeum tardum]|nr:MAG: kelch repeat-containing protein [Candidatus Bathyarchaeum tardum]